MGAEHFLLTDRTVMVQAQNDVVKLGDDVH